MTRGLVEFLEIISFQPYIYIRMFLNQPGVHGSYHAWLLKVARMFWCSWFTILRICSGRTYTQKNLPRLVVHQSTNQPTNQPTSIVDGEHVGEATCLSSKEIDDFPRKTEQRSAYPFTRASMEVIVTIVIVSWFINFITYLRDEINWLVLSDEQMSKRWLFPPLNDEQMSNWVGVKQLPVNLLI